MKTIKIITIFIIVFTFGMTAGLSNVPAQTQTLAFPTAEGFGRFAQGGRGVKDQHGNYSGKVYKVTSLNDGDEEGTLRSCVNADGPRTCVFDVSGTILWQPRYITKPFLTIAGETAPGDGILLRGGIVIDDVDHIIIRHIRLRPAFNHSDNPQHKDKAGPLSTQQSALYASGNNIIFDHVSFTWARDDTMNPSCNDCTIQRSIIANPLFGNDMDGAPKGGIVAQYGSTPVKVSIVKNLWANIYGKRIPNINEDDSQFVNNLFYDTTRDTRIYPFRGPVRADFINNYFDKNSGIKTLQNHITTGNEVTGTKFYLSGNYNRDSDSYDTYIDGDTGFTQISTPNFSDIPPVIETLKVKEDIIGTGNFALTVATDELANVGAMRPKRSSIDREIINDVRLDRKSLYDPYEVVYPSIPVVRRPADFDTDNDGMEDAWEERTFETAAVNVMPNRDHDGDGYTNLEEYLHELAGDVDSTGGGNNPPDPDPGPDPRPEPMSTVSVDKVSYRPGETLTVTVHEGLSNPQEWVAIYIASNPDSSQSFDGNWRYLNGLQTQPSIPVSYPATVTFRAPSIPGTYNIRHFKYNGLDARLDVSVDFLVGVCTGDLNGDGRIDVADLQLMVNLILGADSEAKCADLDSSGTVDIVDLQNLVNQILR